MFLTFPQALPCCHSALWQETKPSLAVCRSHQHSLTKTVVFPANHTDLPQPPLVSLLLCDLKLMLQNKEVDRPPFTEMTLSSLDPNFFHAAVLSKTSSQKNPKSPTHFWGAKNGKITFLVDYKRSSFIRTLLSSRSCCSTTLVHLFSLRCVTKNDSFVTFTHVLIFAYIFSLPVVIFRFVWLRGGVG